MAATKRLVKPSDDEWNFSSNFNAVVPAAAVVVPAVAVAADLVAAQEAVAELVAPQEAAAERAVHPAVEAVGVDARKKQLVQNWLYGE